jgi:hypothetical protein
MCTRRAFPHYFAGAHSSQAKTAARNNLNPGHFSSSRRETRAAGIIQRVTRGHNGRMSAKTEMDKLFAVKELRRIK